MSQLSLFQPPTPAQLELQSLNRLPALSIIQPWAWAIMEAGKDIENRTWPTPYRGPLVIHAAKTFHRGIYRNDKFAIENRFGIHVPEPGQISFGCLLGRVTLTGCELSRQVWSDYTNNKPREWGVPEQFHWHLRDPIRLATPWPYRGRQGLFRIDFDFGL